MTETLPVTTSPARRVGATLAVGAVLGFASWSFAGPSVIGWWYEPPVKEIYSCASSVESAVRQFAVAQLVCAALGGVIVLLITFFVRRAFSGSKPTAP
jgi:uncharacterized protein YacL